jgi:hypothetical protein
MDKVYICEQCNKKYKSYQTLWKHNKKFHNRCQDNNGTKKDTFGQSGTKKGQLVGKIVRNIPINKHPENTCEYCHKILSCMRSLRRHYTTCKMKKNILVENEQLKDEITELKTTTSKQLEELREQIKELLNKNCKMHYKTLQKINNNGNMNTGTINNTINIMALGHENVNDVLTKAEKITILNKKENALPYMIEMVHFNDKYPQFKNIAITNNRTKHAYLYDAISKVFKMVDKDELVDELIDYRVCDIEEYYLAYKNELELPVKNKIEELIEHRGDNEFTKDKIKLLLFNNRHKVTV